MPLSHGYVDLPPITFGTTDDGTQTPVVQPASARYSGTVVVGRSGSGKTGVLDNICLTDANALDAHGAPVCGVLYLDTHDGPRHILPRIRPERRKDVYLVSLFPDAVPMFPIFGDIQSDDDINNLASLLVDAWRVQHGADYVGPRTEEALTYALLTVSRIGLSPVEVLGAIALRDYRKRLLQGRDLRGEDVDLYLYWRGVMGSLRDDTWALWSHPAFNKLSPLITNRWLRLATSGSPPLLHDREVEFEVLYEADLLSVTHLSDGWLAVTRGSCRDRSGHLVTQFVQFSDDFDPWLVSAAHGNRVACGRYPLGVEVEDRAEFVVDLSEPGLAPVSDEELDVWGPTLERYVARRRRRRGFTRFCQLELAHRRSAHGTDHRQGQIAVREAVSLQDLLDDRKIVMFEIPEFRGRQTAKTLATFALIQALMRGHRQLGLPPERVVPVSIVGDETALYSSETLETTYRELRKAKVSLAISLVRQRQLAMRNTELMRGVMDNVGTRAVLNPAGREAEDFARELDIPVEDLRGMGTGDAYIDTLDAKDGRGSVRTRPVRCRLTVLPPGENSASAEIRRRSLERFYRSRDEAQTNFEHRAALMLASQGREPEHPGGLAARKQLYQGGPAEGEEGLAGRTAPTAGARQAAERASRANERRPAWRRAPGEEDGQAIVEFALIAPLLFGVIFFTLGLLFHVTQLTSVVHSAHLGSRVAAAASGPGPAASAADLAGVPAAIDPLLRRALIGVDVTYYVNGTPSSPGIQTPCPAPSVMNAPAKVAVCTSVVPGAVAGRRVVSVHIYGRLASLLPGFPALRIDEESVLPFLGFQS